MVRDIQLVGESGFESRVVWPKVCHLTIPTADPNSKHSPSLTLLRRDHWGTFGHRPLLLVKDRNPLEKDNGCHNTTPKCGGLKAWESSQTRSSLLPPINVAPQTPSPCTKVLLGSKRQMTRVVCEERGHAPNTTYYAKQIPFS